MINLLSQLTKIEANFLNQANSFAKIGLHDWEHIINILEDFIKDGETRLTLNIDKALKEQFDVILMPHFRNYHDLKCNTYVGSFSYFVVDFFKKEEAEEETN